MPDLTQAKSPEEVTQLRLQDQLDWYSAKSTQNKNLFQGLKMVTIISAALIPVLVTSQIPYGTHVSAGLGVLIAIIEGLQQLKQYHGNWISYRATAEALKHEQFLYLAKAGPYVAAEHPQSMLAERVESLITQEEGKWVSTQNLPNQQKMS
jgi:Protein of unknown function (DUF4231)